MPRRRNAFTILRRSDTRSADSQDEEQGNIPAAHTASACPSTSGQPDSQQTEGVNAASSVAAAEAAVRTSPSGVLIADHEIHASTYPV